MLMVSVESREIFFFMGYRKRLQPRAARDWITFQTACGDSGVLALAGRCT